METPEGEVHGAVIERLRSAYEAQGQAVLAVVADLTEFAERFAATSERIKERRQTWKTLAQEHQVKLFVLENNGQAQLETLKALRAWAAPRLTTLEVNVTDTKEEKNEQ